ADALPILRPHLTPQSSPTACTRRSRRTYAQPRKPPTPSPTLTWWSTRGLPNTERNPHDRHYTRTSRGADRHPPPRPVRPARAHLPRRPRPRGKPVVDRRPAAAGVPGPLPLRTGPPAGAEAALRLRVGGAQTRARRRPRTRRARLPGLAYQGRPRSSAGGPRAGRDPAQTRRLRADPGHGRSPQEPPGGGADLHRVRGQG